MLNKIESMRRKEIIIGQSLIGAHKDKISFLLREKDSRFFMSQGEQRTVVVAFKILEILYHHEIFSIYPVLLLDDVISELDINKEKSLLSFLKKLKNQVFIASTKKILDIGESYGTLHQISKNKFLTNNVEELAFI